MGMRAAVEAWFDKQGIRPRVVGEFEDSALMEVCSAGGRGFTVVHTVIDRAALKHYNLRRIAKVQDCSSEFYAITAERLVRNIPRRSLLLNMPTRISLAPTRWERGARAATVWIKRSCGFRYHSVPDFFGHAWTAPSYEETSCGVDSAPATTAATMAYSAIVMPQLLPP